MAYGGGYGRSRGGYGDSNGYTNGYATLLDAAVPLRSAPWLETHPALTSAPICHSRLATDAYLAYANYGTTYGSLGEMWSVSQPM